MLSKTVIFAGTGICSVAHITKEVESVVQQAEAVLYLVNEDSVGNWIQDLANNAFSLDELYFNRSNRNQAYEDISTHISNAADKYNALAVLVYGHPLLLSDVITKSIKKLKNKVNNIKVLPGISSYDCMLADLSLDPKHGCFEIDATVLIKKRKHIDPSNHLIIWQLGTTLCSKVIGNDLGSADINALKEYLLEFYSPEQTFIVYEASLFPHIPPIIIKTTIEELTKENISHISTGYIPRISH